MLRTSFVLGVALGLIAGALSLEVGVLIVLLVVPTCVWGLRERGRPFGCAGLLTGAGLGMIAILAWSELRCSADPTCEMSTPLTGFYLFGAAVALIGIALAIVAIGRRRHRASRK